MSIFRQIFETLREYYAANPDYLWWSQNPVEVIIGAVLVPGSTWLSVDKVLNELRTQELLDFHKIVRLTDDELAALIRSVGFQTKKAVRLRALIQLILERSGGDLDHYFSRDVEVIRRELLSISGIGHSTADNILLYAGQVPIYMVDTFTERVLKRHGIVNLHANETQIQELIHRDLTPDEEPYGAKLFQKMQELLVWLGRDFCDKSRPDCFHCPLNSYLPDGGAIGLSATSAPQPKRPNVSSQKEPPVQTPKRPVETPDLNETERTIFEAVGEKPMPIDEVVLAVQLPVHIVRATIAVLQMKKVVCQVEGNQVRRV
jgi:endonuclease-3 related protein